LNSFSQTDTTKVKINTPIARLVVKDLLLGDSCFEELKLTQQKLIKIQEREAQKDNIIKLLNEKDENNKYIIHQQELQIGQYAHLTDDLHKELKSERRGKLFWKITTYVGILTTSYLLIK
jgi:hypothetical protein